MKIKTITLAAALLLSAAMHYSCSGGSNEAEEVIRPVRYQEVTRSGGSVMRTFSGISKAETETDLSFRVGGIIQTINVAVGQQVKEGDLVAAIDTTDFKLQLEDARAGVENARVQQETARANLSRIRELYENNNIALSEYEGAKNQYASAKATYDSKQKQFDLQQRQLSYGTLVAPVDGYVASVPVEKNENVQAGQLVASIISGTRMEVEVGMPGAFIHLVKPGMKTTVRFSHTSQPYTGVVTKVSQVGSASSTFPVSVLIDQVTEKIRPGMAAEVGFSFGSGDSSGKILVPASAVAEDSDGRFVFVLEMGPETGFATVHRNPVTVGELTGAGLEIRDGLSEGQFIVTSGVSMITDQMKVRVPQ